MLAMGWEGHHLKEIRCGGITYFTRQAGGEDPDKLEGFPQRNSFQYTLGDILKLPGDTFTFIYDLGDCWKHIVTLVDIRPNMYEETDGDFAGAHLLSGQGSCPPEDVGGVYGYADMLKALANPNEDGDEREEYLNWMVRDFDPCNVRVKKTKQTKKKANKVIIFDNFTLSLHLWKRKLWLSSMKMLNSRPSL